MTDPCSSYRERLHLYLDGEVKSPEAQEIEIHLAECPFCHSSLEEMRSLERHLRAGLHDFVGCPHPAGVDGLSQTIERVMKEPKPPWKNASYDSTARSRRRFFGWGALLLVGAATTLAVMRLSPIATAPVRIRDGSRPAETPATPVSAGIVHPGRTLRSGPSGSSSLDAGFGEAEAGFGKAETSGDAIVGMQDVLEKETDALLAGPATGGDPNRARRLRSVGRMWERLAIQEHLPHAYQRAIDAFRGAMSFDPQRGSGDSSDVWRVRQEAAAPHAP
jgi:hypothetical protein